MNKLARDLDDQTRTSKRALDAKDGQLQAALGDLARTESRLREREADLGNLQNALQERERESKKLGESATTTRFSLQLEVDRFKRDLERAGDDLTRLRAELAAKEASHREREVALDKLHAENRDLVTQLATQTQARLNMGEKLDMVQRDLKEREAELSGLRAKATDLESRLSKDQRSLLQAEGMYRDQLTERNTLLLTIYQYLDKILGVDKTPVSCYCLFAIPALRIHTNWLVVIEEGKRSRDEAVHQL
jgi:chromosome segregation ATPase